MPTNLPRVFWMSCPCTTLIKHKDFVLIAQRFTQPESHTHTYMCVTTKAQVTRLHSHQNLILFLQQDIMQQAHVSEPSHRVETMATFLVKSHGCTNLYSADVSKAANSLTAARTASPNFTASSLLGASMLRGRTGS